MLLPEEADPRKSKLLHGDADEGWNLRSKFSPEGYRTLLSTEEWNLRSKFSPEQSLKPDSSN